MQLLVYDIEGKIFRKHSSPEAKLTAGGTKLFLPKIIQNHSEIEQTLIRSEQDNVDCYVNLKLFGEPGPSCSVT